MTEEERFNPYQTPTSGGGTADAYLPDVRSELIPREAFRRIAVRWFVVCGISCVPSFMMGLNITSSPALGMVTGVILFALGYTALDYVTATSSFRQDKQISRTLKIAYGTRIAISIIFPIGVLVDVLCGMVSVSTTQFLFGSEQLAVKTFIGAVATTLVQGLVMNVVLGFYALLVHAVQWVIIRLWQ